MPLFGAPPAPKKKHVKKDERIQGKFQTEMPEIEDEYPDEADVEYIAFEDDDDDV